MKKIEIKLENCDPTGYAIQTVKTSMELYGNQNDEESMIKNRLFIHIGECIYQIDEKGFIIERIIPKYPIEK